MWFKKTALKQQIMCAQEFLTDLFFENSPSKVSGLLFIFVRVSMGRQDMHFLGAWEAYSSVFQL